MEAHSKRNTKLLGDRSEAMAIAAFVAAGYDVSIPFGENHRYDLIVEKTGILARVQVKTGRLRSGALRFNCYSSHRHRDGSTSRLYSGDVDLFAVYCPETGNVFVIPMSDLAAQKGFFRLEAPKNGQRRRIKWASSYLLDTNLPKLVGTEAPAGVPSPAQR